MEDKQKQILNDLIHSALIHQQSCEENWIKLTAERRALNQAKQRLLQAESEKTQAELDLLRLRQEK